MRFVASGALLILLGGTLVVPNAPPAEWPGFRGPDMDGLALGASLPERWSATEHVRWAVDVPGQGWSSPIVARGNVYLTSAISKRPFKQPTPGIYGNDYIAEMRAAGLSSAEVNKRLRARDNEVPEESDAIRYMVYAFDARTGALKWEREAHQGLPIGGRHRKNTYASETPFTDGERVYVSFGLNIGLFCYALDGTLLWKRTWPPQPIYLDFGTGSSPVVHAGRVYLLQDSERESFLTALDARTGADVWRVPRTEKSTFNRTSVLVDAAHLEELGAYRDRDDRARLHPELRPRRHGAVARGARSCRWRRRVAAGDVLFVGTGAQEGDAARPFFAIKAGASGDITLLRDATSNAYVLWSHPRASGYTPSPLVHQGRVYLVHDTGTMLVRRGGYRQGDLPGPRRRRRPHVLGVAGRDSQPHLFSRRGRRDDRARRRRQLREIAQNDLGEMTLASPAVAGNALFIRTDRSSTGSSSRCFILMESD